MTRITPQLFNVAVTTSGQLVSTRGGSLPTTLALPAEARILAWSVSTAPTDSSGGIYVSDFANGPTTSSEMATLLAAGYAVQMDVGEALVTPPNLAGPFELTLAITAVSGIAQVRLTLWIES